MPGASLDQALPAVGEGAPPSSPVAAAAWAVACAGGRRGHRIEFQSKSAASTSLVVLARRLPCGGLALDAVVGLPR